jgi:hypothetical protein
MGGELQLLAMRQDRLAGAYYPDDSVNVAGETVASVWGDRMIGIHHCPICGCGTHWWTLGQDFGKMGVMRASGGFNATMVAGNPSSCTFEGDPVEVRLMDNLGG